MILKLVKFGDILISRPSGKEAFLAFQSTLKKIPKEEPIQIDFKGIITLTPSWLDEFIPPIEQLGYQIGYKNTQNGSVQETLKLLQRLKENPPPRHPWRLCPLGQHWVNEHPRTVKQSKKNPSGSTIVDGHCRWNPSKKDSIYPEEMKEISKKVFPHLPKDNLPSTLKIGTKTFDQYDFEIGGWTRFWNEIFQPADPLPTNLVKALIFSESSMNATPIRRKKSDAVGLMQLLPQTIQILGNTKGELKNDVIHLTIEEAMDPSLNIAAGIRWLFHKKTLASNRIKRPASWEEAVAEYKDVLRRIKNKKSIHLRNERLMKQFFIAIDQMNIKK